MAGRWRADLAVLSWEEQDGPLFGRAVLALRSPAPAASQSLGQSLLPPPGASVYIVAPRQSGCGQFRGVVSCQVATAGEDGETLTAEVQHWLAAALAEPVVSPCR